MEYQKREYQDEAVLAGVNYLKNKSINHGIMVLPTGSGKSLVIARIVKELDGNTIVLQPTKEILEQNYSKLKSYGFYASVYSASLRQKKVGKITLATIGSVINKVEIFEQFKYIIIDECHLVNPKGGMYTEFIRRLENARALGLTATPYRLSSARGLGAISKFLTRTRPKVFSDVIYYVQNGSLFAKGYLCKLEYYSIHGFIRKGLKLNSTGAEFDDRNLIKYMKEIEFAKRIVEIVERLLKAGRKSILVFTRFIYESEYVARQVSGAAIVTGDTDKKQREKILNDFKSGKIKVVCNVGVLTVGFDYPELETVILARPTMSLTLYYQMIGRAIRPHKNKESAWIIDMCDNIRLFGKVETMTLELEGKSKWYIHSNGKRLTNVFFDANGEVTPEEEPKYLNSNY